MLLYIFRKCSEQFSYVDWCTDIGKLCLFWVLKIACKLCAVCVVRALCLNRGGWVLEGGQLDQSIFCYKTSGFLFGLFRKEWKFNLGPRLPVVDNYWQITLEKTISTRNLIPDFLDRKCGTIDRRRVDKLQMADVNTFSLFHITGPVDKWWSTRKGNFPFK